MFTAGIQKTFLQFFTGFMVGVVSVLGMCGIASAAVSFQTPQDFAVGASPVSLNLADYDGDQRPDIATANQDAGVLSLLLSRGATQLLRTAVSVQTTDI